MKIRAKELQRKRDDLNKLPLEVRHKAYLSYLKEVEEFIDDMANGNNKKNNPFRLVQL